MSGPDSMSQDSRSQHSIPLTLAEGQGHVLYFLNLGFSIWKMDVFVLTIKLKDAYVKCLARGLEPKSAPQHGPATLSSEDPLQPQWPPCSPSIPGKASVIDPGMAKQMKPMLISPFWGGLGGLQGVLRRAGGPGSIKSRPLDPRPRLSLTTKPPHPLQGRALGPLCRLITYWQRPCPRRVGLGLCVRVRLRVRARLMCQQREYS